MTKFTSSVEIFATAAACSILSFITNMFFWMPFVVASNSVSRITSIKFDFPAAFGANIPVSPEILEKSRMLFFP